VTVRLLYIQIIDIVGENPMRLSYDVQVIWIWICNKSGVREHLVLKLPSLRSITACC